MLLSSFITLDYCYTSLRIEELIFHKFCTKFYIKWKKRAQYGSKNPETVTYHHNLIKIIIVEKLRRRHKSWEDFLIDNLLGEETQIKG